MLIEAEKYTHHNIEGIVQQIKMYKAILEGTYKEVSVCFLCKGAVKSMNKPLTYMGEMCNYCIWPGEEIFRCDAAQEWTDVKEKAIKGNIEAINIIKTRIVELEEWLSHVPKAKEEQVSV